MRRKGAACGPSASPGDAAVPAPIHVQDLLPWSEFGRLRPAGWRADGRDHENRVLDFCSAGNSRVSLPGVAPLSAVGSGLAGGLPGAGGGLGSSREIRTSRHSATVLFLRPVPRYRPGRAPPGPADEIGDASSPPLCTSGLRFPGQGQPGSILRPRRHARPAEWFAPRHRIFRHRQGPGLPGQPRLSQESGAGTPASKDPRFGIREIPGHSQGFSVIESRGFSEGKSPPATLASAQKHGQRIRLAAVGIANSYRYETRCFSLVR